MTWNWIQLNNHFVIYKDDLRWKACRKSIKFTKKIFLTKLVQNLSLILILKTIFQKTDYFSVYAALKCAARNSMRWNTSGVIYDFWRERWFPTGGNSWLPRRNAGRYIKKNWHQLSYSFQRKGPVTHEITIGIALSHSMLVN